MNEVNFYSHNEVIEKNCNIIKEELEKKYKRVNSSQWKTPRGYEIRVSVITYKNIKYRFSFALDIFVGDAYGMIGYIETYIEQDIGYQTYKNKIE